MEAVKYEKSVGLIRALESAFATPSIDQTAQAESSPNNSSKGKLATAILITVGGLVVVLVLGGLFFSCKEKQPKTDEKKKEQ